MIEQGEGSESRCSRVSNDGLINLMRHKVYSGPLGNLREPPFDGDEMNMHMPQNVLAETELRHLAAIPYQIISPTGNVPIIGIYQDSLLGSYRLTRPNITMTPRDAMNLLMMFPRVNTNAIREKGAKLSSFDVLSQILPPMTMVYKTKLFEEGEDFETSNNVLEIRNGKLLRGQLEKSVLGSVSKGILHRVCNDFGNIACANFNDDLQNIVTEYMKSSSFSVGISDLIANKKTNDEIIQVITAQKLDVQQLIDKVHLGIFENTGASSNAVDFETKVNNLLNKATEQSGKIGRKSLSKDNRFLMIVESGSKGSLINISQMISCLGQQNVDGKRIPYGFDSRTLPHYNKFDDSPNARGFIENSYITGLTAPELFFHAMGGRIGLIDTAVKTSQTGYIQRRLIKGLEDLKVEYDMTVRNSKGKIIQFVYGDDGFDSTKVEHQTIPLVGMSMEDIYMHYDIPGINNEKDVKLAIYTKGTISRMTKQREATMAKCKTYIDKMIDARNHIVEYIFKFKNDNLVRLPVAFQNIIVNIQGQLNITTNSAVDITPLETFELIEEYFAKLNSIYYAKTNPLFEIMYYFYLTPRDLLAYKHFHRKGLILVLETILLKFREALVHPGEMVGVIAGQGIGEPTTQLTLNSLVYAEEIVVRNSKKEIIKLKIGEFTENQIKLSQKIDYMKDKDTTYAELLEYYEVPCSTENGETVWRRIEAVTQHPVINEDGTNTMLKVTTKGNREVTATKAKSFLQLVDGKIIGVTGKDLNVGDYLPASIKPLDYTEQFTLNYMKLVNLCDYNIPKNIELDYNFGYLIGAYCAEGCITNRQISISNNDTNYFKPILELCKKWNISVNMYTQNTERTSQDICIDNTVLCRILENLCGKLSHNKYVSPKIVFSNRKCILGFLDAYISGDGGFNIQSNTDKSVKIEITSVSKQMLTDVMVMLKNLNIVGNIHNPNNRGSKDIKQIYELQIKNKQSQKLGSILNLSIKAKQQRVEQLLQQEFMYEHSKSYLTVPNIVNGGLIMQDRNDQMRDLIFDQIVSIEEVFNTTNYAYDLTVEDTRNFDCYNGLCMRDTFHLSGVASKSNVTRGVPRIEEILRLTKNPKNPSLTVHLKPIDEQEQDKATNYSNMLEHLKLVNVVKSMQVCFDPNETTTFIQDDKLLLEQYYEFEKLMDDCTGQQTASGAVQKSKWIIRMEMDAEILLDKNITMDDIHFAISNSQWGNDITCVYSDYNMDKLVFRIRMNSSVFSKTKKRGTAETLDQSDEIYMLKNFQDTLLNNIVLRGVDGIKNVIARKLQNYVIKEDGKYNKKDVWVLDTTGSNLLETLGIDFIDYTRTYSNDIKEVFDVLGIEAARQVIFNELSEVMEFSDVYINYHHISLLCDRMTCNKDMVSIFRSGLLNDNVGPIAKATFEVHTEVFLNAARHADFDHMRGVSANVMCGQYGYYGTSAFNVVLDMKAMETLDDAIVDITNKATEIEKMFGKTDKETDVCSKSQIAIQNNIVNIKRLDEGVCDDDYDAGF